MAKTATAATLPPLVLAPTAPILYQHERAVIEQQNWSVGRRPVIYLAVVAAPNEGLASNSPSGAHLYFADTLNSWVERLRIEAYINPDVQSIRVSGRCTFAATETGEIRFTIGAANVTLSFNNGTNGSRVTNSLATSSTGTGWRTITVELRRTAGGTTNLCRSLSIQSEIIAATSLPDPANS